MKIRDLIKVLADYDQDGEVYPDLLRSILPSPGHTPDPPTHTDFGVMMADIRSVVKDNPGAIVFPSDDPAARYVGFAVRSGEVDKAFTIRLHNLRPALSETPALSTPEGRRDLCRHLTSGS